MVDYDPFSPEVRDDPHPIYKRLRDESPVHHLQQFDAWALSRFQDIWDCSSHKALSVARGTTPSQLLTRTQPVRPMLNLMDPPDHTQLRVAVRPRFSHAAIRDMEPAIRGIVRDCIDKVIGSGECDVIRDVSAQLSVKVACMAIGIPLEDGARLSELLRRFFDRDPKVYGVTADGILAAGELTAYFMELVERRRRSADDANDVINLFRDFELNGRKLKDEEIGSHLSMLIVGASEIFPKTFANAIYRLAEHPEQRAECVADPSLILAAYEESLRYDMPTQFLCRTLTEDVELHGQVMPRGSAVMLLYNSANRDDREFESPDVFDIHRRPQRILTFGTGTHACLGLHVAKMEGRVALEETLKSMPEYEVLHDRAERLPTECVQGFASLPIRFEAR